jgi:phosphoglycolate phosphatase-like HAD superfamily hydrolase|tara:strand:+ start:100 stop:765 length:666 start_codon:yes stop_codon:yes gene_type:complete
MRQFKDYDVIIFDCDGVILDSNTLKITAMRNALTESILTPAEVNKCTTFFAENFGKSRFYHVDYFVEHLITIENSTIEKFKHDLLFSYSQQCKSLYLFANKTPFISELLIKCSVSKYVASGSEQQELKDVFQQRQLDCYFKDILGSPEKKVTHVTNILSKNPSSKAVMIGDAVSDLEAAKDNYIDFIFYSPYSNVEEKMRALCHQFNYRIIDSFEEVLKEL